MEWQQSIYWNTQGTASIEDFSKIIWKVCCYTWPTKFYYFHCWLKAWHCIKKKGYFKGLHLYCMLNIKEVAVRTVSRRKIWSSFKMVCAKLNDCQRDTLLNFCCNKPYVWLSLRCLFNCFLWIPSPLQQILPKEDMYQLPYLQLVEGCGFSVLHFGIPGDVV